MPQRSERFLWVYGPQVGPTLAAQIEASNSAFVSGWQDCPVHHVACVNNPAESHRLWLFRLVTTDQSLATKFERSLRIHMKNLPDLIRRPGLELKRRTNLPTPLVCPRVGAWKTDIGLHAVNDAYNGMLITYTYHAGQAGRYHIPHFQLVELETLVSEIGNAWRSVACDCHTSIAGCCGHGCYNCFQPSCPRCGGTGWQDFAQWVGGGFRIDYSGGYPIATLYEQLGR